MRSNFRADRRLVDKIPADLNRLPGSQDGRLMASEVSKNMPVVILLNTEDGDAFGCRWRLAKAAFGPTQTSSGH